VGSGAGGGAGSGGGYRLKATNDTESGGAESHMILRRTLAFKPTNSKILATTSLLY
jgi:hypothetical protein